LVDVAVANGDRFEVDVSRPKHGAQSLLQRLFVVAVRKETKVFHLLLEAQLFKDAIR